MAWLGVYEEVHGETDLKCVMDCREKRQDEAEVFRRMQDGYRDDTRALQADQSFDPDWARMVNGNAVTKQQSWLREAYANLYELVKG
ncbi:MAG: hypothetical protein ACLUD2_10935 [Clostridium sp.]